MLKRYLSFNDALCEYVGNEGKSNEDIEKVEEKEYEDLTLLARDKDFWFYFMSTILISIFDLISWRFMILL